MAVVLYFGLPGCGKSTLSAKIVYDNTKRNIKTYCNFPVVGAIPYDVSEFGSRKFFYGDLIIDEASIDLNSRSWKKISISVIAFLKKYRHNSIRNIYVFSQAPDDVDITVRRLASKSYYIRKSLFGFSSLRALELYFDVNDLDHQPFIGWRFKKWSLPRLFYRPKYYGLFESKAPLESFADVVEPPPYTFDDLSRTHSLP